MSRILTVINQKGGTGKTTTALNIGGYLHLNGKRVLFIDLDSQGNLSYGVGAKSNNSFIQIANKEIDIREAIENTINGNIIPSYPLLTNANTEIEGIGKEYRLKEALEPIRDEYDYIIIDTPPALSILTINTLTASDEALIVAQADIFSLQGIAQLSETIRAVKEYTNPNLSIIGILLTRYDKRLILNKEITEILDDTAKILDTKVLDTKIRENVAIREAQANQEYIFTYSTLSNGSKDYQALVKEIIKEVKHD